jgi:hypothetical protein
MSDEIQDTNQEPSLAQPGLDAQPEQSVPDADSIGLDGDSIDLALRFLVGLLALGGDEAARRLQEMQRKLDADPTLWSSQAPAGQKTLRRQAWHLGVGLARRGQKGLRRGIRQGYDLSRRAMDRVSSTPGGRVAGRLTRPVRKPVGARVVQWRTEAALIEKEGELEELKGRALASGVLAALIVELMDEIAKNPELLDFIQDLLSQQGRGMATSVVDNTRSVALTADDAVDALLRWLLRRTPRGELPPSPVEGKPQKMYTPTAKVEEGAPDVD